MRRVALVLAGVALVGLAVLAAAAYLATTHSDLLLAEVSSGLGREVHADRLGFTFRGGVGVALSGARIGDDPAFDPREPFVTARSFEMRLRLPPLLRRRLVVDRILIDEPVVNLVRDAGGHLNVDSLGRRASPPKEAAGPGGPGPGRPAFQLASLRLRHGTIRYRERASGRTVELADVAADARQPHFDALVPLSLRARLATQDFRLDDIVSEGVLDLAAERPAYRGSLRAGPGTLGPIALERLTADVRATPPVVDLDGAALTLLGGTASSTAHLAAEGADAGFTAKLDARGIDLAKLPLARDRPHPTGTLELHGTVAGPPPGSATFAAAATGQGRFDVADGRLAGVVLGRGLLDAIAPILKPGMADRLRQRYPDLFASDELRFTRLSGSGRLAGGRVRTEDLVLAGASYDARGAGSVGLDGDCDLVLRLSASPQLTDDLLGNSRARPVLVDASGRLTVPLRLRGPLERPHVTPDPSFAASAARAALGGAGLEGLAEGVLQRFLGAKRKR